MEKLGWSAGLLRTEVLGITNASYRVMRRTFHRTFPPHGHKTEATRGEAVGTTPPNFILVGDANDYKLLA